MSEQCQNQPANGPIFNTHGHWETSPVVCWLTLHLPVPGACIPSLVGKLRSHMPWGVAKKKKKRHALVGPGGPGCWWEIQACC